MVGTEGTSGSSVSLIAMMNGVFFILIKLKGNGRWLCNKLLAEGQYEVLQNIFTVQVCACVRFLRTSSLQV